MGRASALLLPLLALIPGAPADTIISNTGDDVAPPEFHEDRTGVDWTYRPNYNLTCKAVGCCGAPNASVPATADLQACGPEFWKFLSNVTAVRCVSDGKSNQQSPIQFITEGPNKQPFIDAKEKVGGNASMVTPVFSKNQCMGDIDFKGNTWEIDFGKNCSLSVQLLGKNWKLQQFHFHNAEHSINGAYMPLEIHMVHSDDQKNGLVLSVFLTPGDENSFFKKLEKTPGGTVNETMMVNPYDLIPPDQRYWHYEGSLTTPPCQLSDGAKVQWFVFRDPVEISMNQLAFFGSYFTHIPKAYNGLVNRPLQPIASNTKLYMYPMPAATSTGKGKRALRA